MKSKTITKISIATLLLLGIEGSLSMRAGAANLNTEEYQASNVQSKLSNEDIHKADQFVKIVNNRYVLDSQANGVFNGKEVNQLKSMLVDANRLVENNSGEIDLSDKSFETDISVGSMSPFTMFAASSRKYTYKHFWWGTRFYFRSNAAVTQMVRELKSSAKTMSAFALGAGGAAITVAGPYAAIPGMLLGFASYTYTNMADCLNNYNSDHKKHQIYMDVNMMGNYSCHILK